MNEYKKYETLLKDYPDIISKEQLYKICHISKRTALFFLESGIIPCINSGKQTRKYKVSKKDVVAFLVDRDRCPEKYKKPSGWYKGQSAKMPKELTDKDKEVLRALYTNDVLADCPDVMSVPCVSSVLGYSVKSIFSWLNRGYLKGFKIGTAWKVPKVYLVDFMLSPKFQFISKKTVEHEAILLRSLSVIGK